MMNADLAFVQCSNNNINTSVLSNKVLNDKHEKGIISKPVLLNDNNKYRRYICSDLIIQHFFSYFSFYKTLPKPTYIHVFECIQIKTCGYFSLFIIGPQYNLSLISTFKILSQVLSFSTKIILHAIFTYFFKPFSIKCSTSQKYELKKAGCGKGSSIIYPLELKVCQYVKKG